MKIVNVCMKCAADGISDNSVISYSQINDENIYQFTCQNGHKNVVIHQVEKFEMLFESAANAIMDGYFREAVSSIAASLERLYEFAIRVILAEKGMPFEQVENAWKHISRQSERQLGAFIFQYLDKFKTIPPLLPSKQVEFRNEVIHKGYFPNYDETIAFGEKTLELMFEIVLKLKEECDNGLRMVTLHRAHEAHKQAQEITNRPITMASPSIIDLRLGVAIFKPIKLVDYLQKRKKS